MLLILETKHRKMARPTKENILDILQSNSETLEVEINGKKQKLTFIGSINWEDIAEKIVNNYVEPIK